MVNAVLRTTALFLCEITNFCDSVVLLLRTATEIKWFNNKLFNICDVKPRATRVSVKSLYIFNARKLYAFAASTVLSWWTTHIMFKSNFLVLKYISHHNKNYCVCCIRTSKWNIRTTSFDSRSAIVRLECVHHFQPPTLTTRCVLQP